MVISEANMICYAITPDGELISTLYISEEEIASRSDVVQDPPPSESLTQKAVYSSGEWSLVDRE